MANLDLFLFENSAKSAQLMIPSGINNFLVDWEFIDKYQRQNGYDTEINTSSAADLKAVSSIESANAWCRVNGHGQHTVDEIELAIESGAQGIFLPMVTTPTQVEIFLRLVNNRCSTGILIETVSAVKCSQEISSLPVNRIYFGLNDYAISRGGGSIFTALLDGTVEKSREIFINHQFGFGGLTSPNKGEPILCSYLIQEMARLSCGFSFLRRSFRKDIQTIQPSQMVANINNYWELCNQRSKEAKRSDQTKFLDLLRNVCDES